MATNNIKAFATSSSANVLNDTELASRSELQTGFPFKSKADSKLVGKLMQNATAGAYAVGEFSAKYGTMDITGSDATGFATAFESALQAYVNEKAPSPDLSAYVTKENAALTGTATLNGQNIATVNQIPDVSTKINVSGSRGTLAGYETTSVGATALTVNQGSPDSQQLTAAVAITVSNGTANTAWVKKVSIKDAGVTISIGSAWSWVGGAQPTVTAPSLLILSWDNDCGIAILQTTGS